jgi:serine/threonine-protein kinase
MQHLQETPRPLKEVRSDLPQAVCDVVARLMAKNPDDRYPDATELLTDLKRLSRAVKSGDIHELSVAKSSGKGLLPFRNFGLQLAVTCFVLAGISAAAGWYLRPTIPKGDPTGVDGSIPRLADARSQYLHAMLLGDNQQAFIAVKQWFPSDRDKLWVHRAEEQLALLYLRDRNQWERADRQLLALENLRSEGELYYAEARIGRAALAAYQGDLSAAERILRSSESLFQQHLTGSWLRLEQEVRRLVNPAGESVSGPIVSPPGN